MMYFIAILVIFVTILYLFLSQNILVMVWQYGLRRFERICLPTRLILIRHGESEGNINHQIYRTVPDSSLRMTEKGKMQLKSTGKALHDLLGNKASIRFIISPYVRTMESYEAIVSAWEDADEPRQFEWSEEPRIREQDFGNFQDPNIIRQCKIQRQQFGSFFYRFPSGESPADVYDRISSFLESLFRMFRKRNSAENYVLVTHGVTIRVLLMRYFRYTVRDFEKLENFHNGETVVLKRGENGMEIEQVWYPSCTSTGEAIDDEMKMVHSSKLRLKTNSQCASPLASPSTYPRQWLPDNPLSQK